MLIITPTAARDDSTAEQEEKERHMFVSAAVPAIASAF
jgi:hypothetical protein